MQLPDGRDDRGRRRRIGDRPRRQRAARGARRGDPPLLRLRQARAHSLRHWLWNLSAPRPRPLVHVPGSRLGRHQVAFPGLDLPRPHRVLPQLPGLRAARRPQGRAPRLALRLDQQRRRVPGLRDSRLGARHGAARALRRRQLLGRVSARRLPARQLGVLEPLGQDHGTARAHGPAGALLHGRRLRDADDPDEELADGEPRPGLRAHGVREGAVRAPRHLRARACATR